jgi:hypothetical protein
MLSFLKSTVSFPVMNLSLNIYEEIEGRKHPRFLAFAKQQRLRQTLAVFRDLTSPMFAPHHKIRPSGLRTFTLDQLREAVPDAA